MSIVAQSRIIVSSSADGDVTAMATLGSETALRRMPNQVRNHATSTARSAVVVGAERRHTKTCCIKTLETTKHKKLIFIHWATLPQSFIEQFSDAKMRDATSSWWSSCLFFGISLDLWLAVDSGSFCVNAEIVFSLIAEVQNLNLELRKWKFGRKFAWWIYSSAHRPEIERLSTRLPSRGVYVGGKKDLFPVRNYTANGGVIFRSSSRTLRIRDSAQSDWYWSHQFLKKQLNLPLVRDIGKIESLFFNSGDGGSGEERAKKTTMHCARCDFSIFNDLTSPKKKIRIPMIMMKMKPAGF